MNEAATAAASVLVTAADTPGLEALRPAGETLTAFGVAWTGAVVPAAGAASLLSDDVLAVIVASAYAVLPGTFAAATCRPVVRVPTAEGERSGLALLHDPATGDLPVVDEAPFATVAIGEAGAKNAALFIVSVLALDDPGLWAKWLAFRQRQTDAVLASPPLSIQ